MIAFRRLARVAALVAIATALLAASAASSQTQQPSPAPKVDPKYPDLSKATAKERSEARRLWRRSKRSAKRLFPSPAAARRRGFRGHVEHVHRPVPFFFHYRKNANINDGRELDPRHPEAIVYWYDPPRPLLLVAIMYRAREGHEPRYGGSIPPWHSHCDESTVVMHTWFTNDLRSSYAERAPRPELGQAFSRDFGDPTPDSAAGCQPRHKP